MTKFGWNPIPLTERELPVPVNFPYATSMGLALAEGDAELEAEAEGLREADGEREADEEEEGEAVATLSPNTAAALPASVEEAEAHVREAMFAPSVVSPDVTAIEKSVPFDVSTSILVVQSGFVSDDMAAANVVKSFP